jgi:hypothetical protein
MNNDLEAQLAMFATSLARSLNKWAHFNAIRSCQDHAKWTTLKIMSVQHGLFLKMNVKGKNS